LLSDVETAYQNFARLDTDASYRYDKSRPFVDIRDDLLNEISRLGGGSYAVKARTCKRDPVAFKCEEPHWDGNILCISLVLSVQQTEGVKSIYAVVSMYDNVLHADRIVCEIASDEALFSRIKEKQVVPTNLPRPEHHSFEHPSEGPTDGGPEPEPVEAHQCLYYLHGVVYFGLLGHLANLLALRDRFGLDTHEMEVKWNKVNRQIQDLIDGNPEVHNMIRDIRRANTRASRGDMKSPGTQEEKVIKIDDQPKMR